MVCNEGVCMRGLCNDLFSRKQFILTTTLLLARILLANESHPSEWYHMINFKIEKSVVKCSLCSTLRGAKHA
jgi:hypothetical protein